MTNSINFNSNSNVFAPIQGTGAPYAITKSFTEKENSEKEEKNNKLGYEIAMTALVAGLGVLTLTKGLPKPARLQIEKFMKKLDTKADVIKQNKHINTLQKLKLNIIEKTKTVAKYSVVILDTAPLKDIVLHSIMKNVPGLKKVDEKITTFFRKISVKKYENAYNKTISGFDNLYADFSDANKKITDKKQLEKAEIALKELKSSYNKTFSATERRPRLNKTIEDLKGLDDEVLGSTYGKSITNMHKSLWQYIKNKAKNPTFISEEKAAPIKNRLLDEVTKGKASVITQKDTLMDIYKNVLEPKEYEKLNIKSDKAVKNLDNAIGIETDKLFDKLRDLAIGSAPMDVAGIVTSIGVISWQLQKADNNDDRISISLKSGIPIVGGMLTSLYCALALVSAGPSLFLGLASGLAINKMGSIADKHRKEYKDKPFDLVENAKPEGLVPVKNGDNKTQNATEAKSKAKQSA